MKKLMFAVAASAAMLSYADTVKEESKELEKQEAPILWGFANYGFYSGYQLYGNLVNCEPTLQGYGEVNFNLPCDLGYAGVGLWSNTDLTSQRHKSYQQAFNEYDPNFHWDKTFWLDDDCTWGINYHTWFVWYIYPNSNTHSTWDWDHTVSLLNPFVTPYITWVHEYSENSNLIEFGLRRPTQISDNFSICPSANFVWREAQYYWCFPTAGFSTHANSGIATMRLQLDANYQVNSWFSIWGKVAYCCTVDDDLRHIQDHCSGADYAKYSDFAWGGVGIAVNF